MKILFLTNNDITTPLILWLQNASSEDVTVFKDKLTEEVIASIRPDFVISYNYHYILSEKVLALLPDKFINLHISLLPWNRGADPNLWSFLDNTPKGVTIHLINNGIDSGKILIQKQIRIEQKKHTLASSYTLLHQEIQTLFKKNWKKIKNENLTPYPQNLGGSMHYKSEHKQILELLGNDSWNIQIEEFINRYKVMKNNRLAP